MEQIIIKEAGKEIYNDRYKYGYSWGVYQKLADEVLRLMNYSGAGNKTIIDIGCGLGWFSDLVYNNVSKNIKAIDFSEKAVNFHLKRIFPCIDAEVANIYDYDYTGFDCAVLMEVLEHLAEDVKLLKKLPSGCAVYFTVPFGKERQDSTHVREYDEEVIKSRYGKILDLKCIEHTGQFLMVYGVRK